MGENKEQEKISIVINKKKEQKKSLKETMKGQFTSRKFRGGAFSSIFIVFILVAVVLVNMIVGQFDFKIDVTQESTYTLTDQTKKVVKDIKDEVKIYYIVENGKEVSIFKNIVDKYEELSDNIKVVYKDPILYPDFATKYAGTGTQINSNSIVVVNETNGNYKYIPYGQMYSLDYTEVYNGNATDPTVTAIDVEGQITSAVQTVTNAKKSKIYAVTGHGETSISDYLKNEFEKLGTEVETLNIRSVGDATTDDGLGNGLSGDKAETVTIPEDCDILYICGPTTDYSETEIAAIKTYLQGGGKAVVMLNYMGRNMTNFNEFMKYYGLQVTEGVVMEDSSHSGGGIPYMSYADVTSSNNITFGITNDTNPIMMPYAQGIQEISGRATLTIEKLLTTSTDAYCKTADPSSMTTYEKEDTDVMGPFDAGVMVSDIFEGKTSEMVVFSSSYVTEDQFVQVENFGNVTLLNNTISYLSGQKTGLSIPKRSMVETYVNTTDSDTVFYTVVLIVVVPIALLAAGFLIWYMRRRRA